MIPTRYITPDNNLEVTLSQFRNNGSISYSISLQIDRDKHDNGINLIDCLILNRVNLDNLFVVDVLPPIVSNLPVPIPIDPIEPIEPEPTVEPEPPA